MKKYFLAISLLVLPLTTHAGLYGFLDGKIYDESGSQKYICFMDGNCLDSDSKVHTRTELFGADAGTVNAPVVSGEPVIPVVTTPIIVTPVTQPVQPVVNPVQPPSPIATSSSLAVGVAVYPNGLTCRDDSAPLSAHCFNTSDQEAVITKYYFYFSTESPVIFKFWKLGGILLDTLSYPHGGRDFTLDTNVIVPAHESVYLFMESNVELLNKGVYSIDVKFNGETKNLKFTKFDKNGDAASN